MHNIPYIGPSFKQTSFNCPFCNAFAQQKWEDLYYFSVSSYQGMPNDFISICDHCHKFAIWHNRIMIYPNFSGIQPPNMDLNSDIQSDYLEASEIMQRSPRGAAALLRLAVQKLSIQLGEKGDDLNTDIGNLVKKGLPVKVQQSLDSLRVIGNGAVHPGQLDLKDDLQTAASLFKLINFIAEKMITEPKEIDEIYDIIPQTKKEQIKARDSK